MVAPAVAPPVGALGSPAVLGLGVPPVGPVPVLLAVKIAVDLGAHLKEHRGYHSGAKAG